MGYNVDIHNGIKNFSRKKNVNHPSASLGVPIIYHDDFLLFSDCVTLLV